MILDGMDAATQALVAVLIAQVILPLVTAFIQRKQGKDEDHIAAVPLLMAELKALSAAVSEMRQDVRAQASWGAELAVLRSRLEALERQRVNAG